MTGWAATLCVLLTVSDPGVETRFVQVAPAGHPAVTRSPGQDRAVVLIHGLTLHPPFNRQAVARADLRPWQEPGSVLVKALAREADVFAFAYGQTVAVNEIPSVPELGTGIRRLRQLGYRQVVLVGFSAGGLIARQLVEDEPDVGVAKVIQVRTPNAGAGLAKVKALGGAAQGPFLQSLTKEYRTRALLQRRDRKVPEGVQFACVVGTGLLNGDGIVSTHSQWPEDLQRQGIPAVALGTDHTQAVRSERAAQVIARLVRDELPRWGASQVSAMRRRSWGEKAGL